MNENSNPCASIAERLRNVVTNIQKATDPYLFRKWIGYQHRPTEFGRLLCLYHPNGHKGQPFNPASIWKFENDPGRYPGPETCEAYRALAQAIMTEIDPNLIVHAQFFTDHWRFRLQRRCFAIKRNGEACQTLFFIQSISDRHCSRHRGRK